MQNWDPQLSRLTKGKDAPFPEVDFITFYCEFKTVFQDDHYHEVSKKPEGDEASGVDGILTNS